MAGTLEKEIGDMLGGLGPEEPEEPKVEEPEVEEPEEEPEEPEVEEPEEAPETPEEAPEEEEPAEEEPEVEEPEEEKPEEEPEEPEEEPDDLDDLRARNLEMSELLLQHGITLTEDGTVVAPTLTPEQVAAAAATAQPPEALTLENLAILGDEENLDDVLNDREVFVGFMRKVLGNYRNLLAQDFTRGVPGMVANQVRQVTTLTNAVEGFYKENEDLRPVRKAVGVIANQVVAEHPGWDLPKVFNESADRTRKVLKMKKPKPKKTGKIINPSFAKSKSKKGQPKPKVSKLQSEIDEIL